MFLNTNRQLFQTDTWENPKGTGPHFFAQIDSWERREGFRQSRARPKQLIWYVKIDRALKILRYDSQIAIAGELRGSHRGESPWAEKTYHFVFFVTTKFNVQCYSQFSRLVKFWRIWVGQWLNGFHDLGCTRFRIAVLAGSCWLPKDGCSLSTAQITVGDRSDGFPF